MSVTDKPVTDKAVTHKPVTDQVENQAVANSSTGQTAVPSTAVAEYALGLGDDALILAQQLGQWISRAPELEEDVALANIALDLLGHARQLLSYAGRAWDKSEDDLAYFRDEPEFRSVHLVEQPNGDFAHTIVRQLIFSSYQFELYSELVKSTDPMIQAIAAKAVKEVDYHRDHAVQWTLRLGIGTDQSHARMATALIDLWPYVDELFHDHAVTKDGKLKSELSGIAVVPSTLRARFDSRTAEVLERAELTAPATFIARGGGRRGVHSEYLGPLLAEMQVLARQHPGASW